jgi:hypothetical protein
MKGFLPTASASAGVAALLIVLVFCGVVLPAIWSREQVRRTAAARVLQQILDFFRRQPGR